MLHRELGITIEIHSVVSWWSCHSKPSLIFVDKARSLRVDRSFIISNEVVVTNEAP